MTAGGVSAMAQSARKLASADLYGTMGKALPRTDDEALRAVTRQFEAIFVGELLKSMRATTLESGLLGDDRASKIYKDMRDEAMAAEMARTGGMGIATMLYDDLRRARHG